MLRRPVVLAVIATALALTGLTACQTGPSSSADPAPSASTTTAVDADAFPVTIHHVYGDTTIDQEPTRVVALGTNDPDDLLALGVVPVGVPTITWGGNKAGSTPWFDAKLQQMGATAPKQFDTTDDIPVEDIAALNPDLILATNSGITKEQYAKLSKIAPVVAYPGAPWTTTWQQSLEMDGKALGRTTLATRLEQQTDDAFDRAKQDYPQLQGKTFIFAALSTADLSSVSYYTPADARPTFLTSIGMVNAPVVERIAPKGAFYGTISAERAGDLKSDVFISYATKASDARTYAADPLIGRIPGIRDGHLYAITDNTSALAAGVPTPLSVPYAVTHFVPMVAKSLHATVVG